MRIYTYIYGAYIRYEVRVDTPMILIYLLSCTMFILKFLQDFADTCENLYGSSS